MAVICPTLNERENIVPLVQEVSTALQGADFEILVVDDDSPDGTLQAVEALARSTRRVRGIAHTGHRSLADSVITGFSSVDAEIVACIDADLQHDPAILPRMLAALDAGADLAIGCRYMPGGGTSDWNWVRRLQSRVATLLARCALGVRLRDPMTGYFMLRRADFLRVRPALDGRGFKILLELVAHIRPQKVVEVPYVFRRRLAGRSKLTARVALDYLAQLWRLSRPNAAHLNGGRHKSDEAARLATASSSSDPR